MATGLISGNTVSNKNGVISLADKVKAKKNPGDSLGKVINAKPDTKSKGARKPATPSASSGRLTMGGKL